MVKETTADVSEADATLTCLDKWLDKPSRVDALRAAMVKTSSY